MTAVVVALLTVAGCSAKPGLNVTDGAVTPADSAQDPFRFPTKADAPDEGTMYPMAAIFGTVMLDPATGCVTIGTDTTVSQVLWPHGYTAQWDGAQVQIRNVGGEVVARTGDPITAGGGTIPAELLPTDNPCLTSGSVFGVNPLEMNN